MTCNCTNPNHNHSSVYDVSPTAAFTHESPYRLESELITEVHTAQDFIDTYERCLGVGKRFCDSAPTEGTPYCAVCHSALDALHARAAGLVPPPPPTPSPITIATTASGMMHMRYGSTTIGVCSEAALEALRLYLAAGIVEAYDDALEMIAELREAA